jgi:hypothetical protein
MSFLFRFNSKEKRRYVLLTVFLILSVIYLKISKKSVQ